MLEGGGNEAREGGRGLDGGSEGGYPFLGAGVEVVGDDVRGGDEDVGDGGVEAAQHVEVERPRALRVRREVRGHLRAAAPAPCHGPRRKP
jgi:hypothetical protein